ncbi:MAG: hypothetical protein ACPGKG_04580 [Paracoccaceae bacterium]
MGASLTYADYKAVLSCSMYGNHISILACFGDTELKLTNNGLNRVYKIYNISQLGQEHSDGLHISLSEKFTIIAQNGHDTLILGINIFDEFGDQVYQEEVGTWGVIKVGN